MTHVVTALFPNRACADAAANALLRAGFRQEDVSVLMSETTRGREFGIVEGTKAEEGALAGAATGGTIGAIVAGVAAVGALAIPGVGLVAAGPIVAALAGVGAGGLAGGAVGALIGAGIPEHEAKLLGPEVARGSILVGVHVARDEDTAKARNVMRSAGGLSLKAA